LAIALWLLRAAAKTDQARCADFPHEEATTETKECALRRNLLAHMLKERSMSQADLVRATGLAKATVSDLVGGKRSFTVDQMHLVAKVFGLPGVVFMPDAANRSS
jgi:antitoxin component HigA of HigAB toxin-antitoxin module